MLGVLKDIEAKIRPGIRVPANWLARQVNIWGKDVLKLRS